jgi:hypothetical protein
MEIYDMNEPDSNPILKMTGDSEVIISAFSISNKSEKISVIIPLKENIVTAIK